MNGWWLRVAGAGRQCAPAALLAVLVFGTSALMADEPREPDSAWAQPKMPPIKLSLQDFYPEAARLHDLQGRVLVAFDITPAGVAKNISIVWVEHEVFSKSAIHMFESAHFTVPADWLATGASRRWRVGIVYRLDSPAPSQPQSDEFAIPVMKFYVTARHISKK